MAFTGLLGQPQTPLAAGAGARAAAAQSSYWKRAVPLVEQDVHPRTARVKLSGSFAGSTIVRYGGLDDFEIDIVPMGTHREENYIVPSLRRTRLTSEVQRPDVLSRLAAIRDLIHKEQIPAARRMLDIIPVGGSEEPAIARLRRALTPPTVRPSARTDVHRGQAYAWLRQHSHEHRGLWVAVGENGLLASAPTLKELRTQIEQLAPVQQPLIHKL